MFIRVSHMRVREGTMDDVMRLAQQLVPMTTGMSGLHEYYTVRASDTELLTVGVWDSPETEQTAAAQLHGWLASNFGPYLDGRPQNWAGDASSVRGR